MLNSFISFIKGSKKTKEKILIIDNRFESLEYLNRILSKKYVVLVAQSKEEAFEKVQGFKPELVILNSKLNKESSLGLCLGLRLLQETRNSPILIITEKEKDSNITEFYVHKIEGLIFEPFTKNDILSQIQTAFLDRRYSKC